MVDAAFQALSAEDKRHALRVSQGLSGRKAYLQEKDAWVVQTLRVLFDAPFGADLMFKGGRSLAKGYQVIRRFSEDIDIRTRLSTWVEEQALPIMEEGFGRAGCGARVRADGERLYIDYEPPPGGGCSFV